MKEIQLLFALIRVAVCGGTPTEALRQDCTPELLEAAIAIAQKHDLAHLVGQSAGSLQLPDSEPLQKGKNAAMGALQRCIRQQYDSQGIYDIFEKGAVPFIPLKGSVLRQWYPEAWMRTGCDIDILVHTEDLPRAQSLLEAAGWQYRGKTSHDLAFRSRSGTQLELHYSTIEDYVSQQGKAILDGIWEDARPVAGKQYHRQISDGLFYYYHMAHMAKHFVHGGCGIRSFLDIWVLNHLVEHTGQEREQLLKKGGLQAFARAAEKLAEIWFSGEPMDPMSLSFQQFVLQGGTYGNVENRVSLQQGREGGRLRFALRRIFLPYDIMKHYFPVLQTHKWLTPLFHPVRWFRLLFCGGAKRSLRELQITAAVSDDTQVEIRRLLDHLEL